MAQFEQDIDLSEPPTAWGEDLALPAGLRGDLERGRLDFLPGPAGYPVPVRAYGTGGGKTPVVMLHGLQSHSGWFAQSAAFLGGNGHPCYAVDRCGSGLSSAPRGDAQDYRAWGREIAAVVQQLQNLHGHERVHVLGHCFGAIPAALFADRHPEWVRGLVFTTPALYARITLPAPHLLKILLTLPGRRSYYLPVPLQTGWFTELEEYRSLIAGDPLALREATGDFYWQVSRARRYLQKNVEKLVMPLWAGTAGADPIADNVRNLSWIGRLPSRHKTLLHYPAARHILEFSTEKDAFFSDLAAWLDWVETL